MKHCSWPLEAMQLPTAIHPKKVYKEKEISVNNEEAVKSIKLTILFTKVIAYLGSLSRSKRL